MKYRIVYDEKETCRGGKFKIQRFSYLSGIFGGGFWATDNVLIDDFGGHVPRRFRTEERARAFVLDRRKGSNVGRRISTQAEAVRNNKIAKIIEVVCSLLVLEAGFLARMQMRDLLLAFLPIPVALLALTAIAGALIFMVMAGITGLLTKEPVVRF
jgi:hypothetical protein